MRDFVELLFLIDLFARVRILKGFDCDHRLVEIQRSAVVLRFLIDSLVEGILVVYFDRLKNPKILRVPSEVQEAPFELAGWNTQAGKSVKILRLLFRAHPFEPLKVEPFVNLILLFSFPLIVILDSWLEFRPEVRFQLTFLLN